jgi:hypothetical protein
MPCNPKRRLFISQPEGALLRQNRKHARHNLGITGAALVVILQTAHRDMPDFIIPAKDKADMVANILSPQK